MSNRSSEDLIAQIKSRDEKVSGPACESAGAYGAEALKPLAALLEDPDFETGRRAKRAMYRIVRHSTAPGSSKQRKAVELALVKLLKNTAPGAGAQRDLVWMLSEVGAEPAVEVLAALLASKTCREDARCALMRIPGRAATEALMTAFRSGPEDFKCALAESLRIRGEKVAGYPSEKLKPSAKTTVVALSPPK